MVEYLPALSTAVFLGITAINVLTSNQGVDPTAPKAKHIILRMILVSTPYAMLVVGVAGLATAMAASRKPHMLGCAAGFLLLELLYIILMGGLVTIARSDVKLVIVGPVTGSIMAIAVCVWSAMCAYPKWVRWFYVSFKALVCGARENTQHGRSAGTVEGT